MESCLATKIVSSFNPNFTYIRYKKLMIAITKETKRFGWLAVALVDQRGRIASLLQRLKGFGEPGIMEPPLFQKFLRMLEQVAVEKDRETEIIRRIQAVEARHSSSRKSRKLKRAAPKPKPGKNREPEFVSEQQCERSRHGWLWIFALLYLTSPRKTPD